MKSSSTTAVPLNEEKENAPSERAAILNLLEIRQTLNEACISLLAISVLHKVVNTEMKIFSEKEALQIEGGVKYEDSLSLENIRRIFSEIENKFSDPIEVVERTLWRLSLKLQVENKHVVWKLSFKSMNKFDCVLFNLINVEVKRKVLDLLADLKIIVRC